MAHDTEQSAGANSAADGRPPLQHAIHDFWAGNTHPKAKTGATAAMENTAQQRTIADDGEQFADDEACTAQEWGERRIRMP